MELAEDGRVDDELLADADAVRVLDVVPLGDLHVAYAEALANAAQDISGGNRVDDVVAVVLKSAVCEAPAAGHVLKVFLIDAAHFFNLLYLLFFYCFCVF